MKALVQRVAAAWVSVNHGMVGKVGRGVVILLGVAQGDSTEDARYLVHKIANMRIFADGESEFALSALDVEAGMLVVSQFTLLADVRKGRRPGFREAAPPDEARRLYEFFVDQLRSTGLKVETGIFQEHMMVRIDNDGPVTLLVESKERQKIN
ncbi:MAG: D-tyrosyl-tRNA(Tyr) deacylase [Dehalococcoidia bacterium]|nr:D-tyrosyl-tRNA(Tyr) deacylase [Dehalococcoidia bacterium]